MMEGNVMEVIEANGFYFPPGFSPEMPPVTTGEYQRGDKIVHLKFPVLTKKKVALLAGYLKEKRDKYLSGMPVEKIVHTLDKASRLWLDRKYPYRKLALKIIPVMTGLSPGAVDESIDVEMKSSLKEDILRALKSETGNPFYLDDFQYSESLNGYCRAFGPRLIVSFFSGNIPALPHLVFMRSLLIKSACLGKLASGEPSFIPLYLKTIEDIDPEMACSLAALYWKGGSKDLESAAFNQADAAILFGGVETLTSVMKRIPRRVTVLTHGHKLGFGVLGRNGLNYDALDALAASVAYDISMFDQHACLAPHVYYVEDGGEVSPKEFAGALANAMKKMETKMPRGALSPGEAALINQLRGRYEFRELNGEDVTMFASSKNTGWTVVCEKDPGIFHASPLNRFIRVFAVHDIFEIIPALRPLGPFLQNAALSIGDNREKEFISRLGEAGVARITSPGNMALPSMMWHHDGIAPISSLLRWCDVEKKENDYGIKSID